MALNQEPTSLDGAREGFYVQFVGALDEVFVPSDGWMMQASPRHTLIVFTKKTLTPTGDAGIRGGFVFPADSIVSMRWYLEAPLNIKYAEPSNERN